MLEFIGHLCNRKTITPCQCISTGCCRLQVATKKNNPRDIEKKTPPLSIMESNSFKMDEITIIASCLGKNKNNKIGG